jgi:hypothetical protein
MNREQRKLRDEGVINGYRMGRDVDSLVRDYRISVSGLFTILKRHKVSRNTYRRPNIVKEIPASLKVDADAYALVARKACKSLVTAQFWLNRADFLDNHPGTPLVKLIKIGASRVRVEHAMQQLLKINATLSTVAPFKVLFTEKMRYLPLTTRQYIIFLAHPYFYLMEHKNDIKEVGL